MERRFEEEKDRIDSPGPNLPDHAYRVLVENCSEGAVILNEEVLVVYCNKAFYNLLGTTYNNIIRQPFINFVQPDSAEAFTALFSKGLAGQSRGEVSLGVQGRSIPVELSLTSLYPHLPIVGLIVTDLREKKREEALLDEQNVRLTEANKKAEEDVKKSQAHFSTLFSMSPVAMSLSQAGDGVVIEVNAAWEQLFDLERDYVVGKTVTELGMSKAAERSEKIRRILEAGGSARGMEMSFRLRSGKKVHAYVSVECIELDGVSCFLAAYFDLRERSLAEDAIKKANRMLEIRNMDLQQANAEMASFSYIASHDLQEPLRKIQTFTGRILEKEPNAFSEVTKDYFARISNAASRMQNLITALLEYSQTSTSELIYVPTRLGDVINEVKSHLREMIAEKQAQIEVTSLPTLEVVGLQFVQLFSNLVMNSIKYHRPGHAPVIRISAQPVEQGNSDIHSPRIWEIRVQDNGIGFAQEYANRIFELFQRLHGRSEYEGTGIGLAICKKIVQNHAGSIRAESKPDEGATFIIRVPETH